VECGYLIMKNSNTKYGPTVLSSIFGSTRQFDIFSAAGAETIYSEVWIAEAKFFIVVMFEGNELRLQCWSHEQSLGQHGQTQGSSLISAH